jgi:hypothetical protein
MVKTITSEVAVIILVGFILTVLGIYMNFENLSLAQRRNVDADMLNNNEIIYGILQLIGMSIIFVGATRGLMRRTDVMANKFVNIMDVFTSLVKKQIEVIDDKECKRDLAEMEEKSRRFKEDMSSLKRL